MTDLKKWCELRRLKLASSQSKGRSFAEVLAAIPDVGTDADFVRVDETVNERDQNALDS